MRTYRGVRGWTRASRRWLSTVRFDHPAQHIVLQDYIDAVEIYNLLGRGDLR